MWNTPSAEEADGSKALPDGMRKKATNPFARDASLRLTISSPSSIQLKSSSSLIGKTTAGPQKQQALPYLDHVVFRDNTREAPAVFSTNILPSGRGWVEPHPSRLPPRRAGVTWASTGTSETDAALTCVFAFLNRDSLADVVVVVCRTWNRIVKASSALQRRRFAFEYRGRDYDESGIFAYLGKRSAAFKSLRSLERTPQVESLFRLAINPAIGPRAPVSVACIRNDGTVYSPTSLANALTCGFVSDFVTDRLPFSWVGVDLGEFKVGVSHYTLGTSASSSLPVPLQWELQGTNDLGSWINADWRVLDRQQTESGALIFTPDRKSQTFECARGVAAQPYRRFRIVQTGVNSHWGHELVASGLELYGCLIKCTLRQDH